ncbi:hypothetical protein GVAV_001716 [Gurleya vavrai]
MNFYFTKFLIIILLLSKIIYFVKASDCCCLDDDKKEKIQTEPFLYTYSSTEFNLDKIEAQILHIYKYLAKGIENITKWLMITVEPSNNFTIGDQIQVFSKSDFIDHINEILIRSRYIPPNFDAKTFFNKHKNGYDFNIIKFPNNETQIKEKIKLALEKHLKASIPGINKNNILKIFKNCKCDSSVYNEKFSDTHIFFVAENVYEEDLDFLYDSILRLKALTIKKQILPSFNISLLSRCEMFENEIKYIDEKTALAANQENSKLYEKIYEIYIISPFYIYQKQKLSESTRIDKFKKIENNVEEIKKNN